MNAIALQRRDNDEIDLYIYDDIINGTIGNGRYFAEVEGALRFIGDVIGEYRIPKDARVLYYIPEYLQRYVDTY